MKNIKKLPKKQLEKFSTIFTQLGLVLVLFIVYITLEHETKEKSLAVVDFNSPTKTFIEIDQEIVFVKEPKLDPKIETPPNNVFIPDEKIKKVDNNTKDEIVILKPVETPKEFDVNTLVEVKEEPTETPIETVPFIMIENAPVFKGCEGLSKAENKKCFDEKMLKFVQRNFDIGIASEVGLRSGKYRISTQFIIDNQGNVVDIKIRAPHHKLEKETQELIEKLPKFTPGMQRNKPVKVKYTLPITFRVD